MQTTEFYPTSNKALIAYGDITCYVTASLEPEHIYYKTTDFDIRVGETYRDNNFKPKVISPSISGFVAYTNIFDAVKVAKCLNQTGYGDPFPNIVVKCVIPAGSRYFDGTPRGENLFTAMCAERIKIVAWKKAGAPGGWHTECNMEEVPDRYPGCSGIVVEQN